LSAQGGDLLLQSALLGQFGLFGLTLGQHTRIFDRLDPRRLLRCRSGHPVLLGLDARSPGAGHLAHPGAPRQALQLALYGHFT